MEFKSGTCLGEQSSRASMPANPDGCAAEPSGGRNLSHALGDMRDVARFDSETAKRFLEDCRVRLVTPGLFRRDNHVGSHPKLLDCCREQVVVDVRNDLSLYRPPKLVARPPREPARG
jgi:hypothetical protein